MGYENRTHFEGTTREFLYPWCTRCTKGGNAGHVFSLPRVPKDFKSFLDNCQDVGMIVGLFCMCGAELIMEAEIEYDSVDVKSHKYHCPQCGARWE